MCVQQDPCQHGGICINTDTGPMCECRNLDYDGPFCEKGQYNFYINFDRFTIRCGDDQGGDANLSILQRRTINLYLSARSPATARQPGAKHARPSSLYILETDSSFLPRAVGRLVVLFDGYSQ